MTAMELAKLEKHASSIKASALEMVARVKGDHWGGGLSVAEILTALYFAVMKVDPKNPKLPDRDRLIFSKGHCANILYAALVERGFASKEILEQYYAEGTLLTGHPTKDCMPGVEVSTGSLGHGLAMGAGMAWAAKYDRKSYRVFVVMSDGECDEGSTWESILVAGHLKIDNLVAIVDYNKIQSFGTTKEVLDLEPFQQKWQAFNWSVREVDGHSLKELIKVLSAVPFEKGKPSVIIAHTVKGKGVPEYENTLASHYKIPDQEPLLKAARRFKT